MEDSQRFFNPWALHLQKLSLELKCPLCLNLLNQPMLLPCNHIFCNICIPRSTQFGCECPACKHHYVDPEIRPAPYMENMITIYRSLDATFKANIFHSVSSDAGRVSEQCPVSVKASADDKKRKKHVETPQGRNSSSGQSVFSLRGDKCVHVSRNDCVEDGNKLTGKTGRSIMPEFEMLCGRGLVSNSKDKSIPSSPPGQVGAEKNGELATELRDMNQMEQLSASSPPSFGDTKDMDGNSSDPRSRNGCVENHTAKTLVDDDCDRAGGEINNRCTLGAKHHARDVKRQKKVNNWFSEMDMKSNGQTHPKVLHYENIATSKRKLEPKFVESLSRLQSTVISDSSDADKIVCAFCHSSKLTDGTGPMVCYVNGKEVVGDVTTLSKVIHVHRKCIDWTPQVYYKGETIQNLESELARASKLKCSSCGQKGAALGCYVNSCRKSYHVPCAYEILDCRWDCEDFLLLCPAHNSVEFPREHSESGKKHHLPTKIISENSSFWATSPNGPQKWVFCGSGLSAEQKYHLVKFASTCGATVSRCWKPDVTHVIAATDANGACTRTLKVLMAILNGRWILTMNWINACKEAMQPVDEEPYEVRLETRGCSGGPKTGRLRALDNAPKLFNNLNFHFGGDFVQAYKDDLINLVITGGGTVTENKEQLVAQSENVQATSTTLVVYNCDPPQGCTLGEDDSVVLRRLVEAEDFADEIGSQVVGHTWILESIAEYKLRLCLAGNEDVLMSPEKI